MKNAINIAKKWYFTLKFPSEFDTAFDELTGKYTSLEGLSIEAGPENAGGNLLLYLYRCEALAEQYAQAGISEEILLDTLNDLVLWTQTHWDLTGKLGVSEIHWLKLHFQFALFRLGRLQFQMCPMNRDIPEAGVKKGSPVLSVHIPRLGPLTKEECDRSFALARAFFAKYFPEWKYKCFVCYSWLLDDTLVRFMNPQANVLAFQRRFQVVHKEESDDILRFTLRWDLKREHLDRVPPTNDFTCRVTDYVKQGGKFYAALGFCK